MSSLLYEVLIEAGFTPSEAKKLSADEYFIRRNSNKTSEEIKNLVSGISSIYQITTAFVRGAISTHPPFAGYNHRRVLEGIISTYGCTAEQATKAVFTHPQFANYNHHRVLEGLISTYSCTAEQATKTVFTQPQFAGYNHRRVIKQLTKLGKLIGIDKTTVIEQILKKPVLAGCSVKRYLAAIDIGRQLAKEGIPNDFYMLRRWQSYYSKSPYVPQQNKLRITQAIREGVYEKEPPLMSVLRKNGNTRIKTTA